MNRVTNHNPFRLLPAAVWVGGTAVFIFLLAFYSPISNTQGDARFSLLVSQALLQEQTIQLDAYEAAVRDQAAVEWRLWEHDDHIYYVYPLGPSILALPIVFLFNLAGYDMRLAEVEGTAQNLISAVIVTAVFLIIYRIARYYLPPRQSLFIAVVTVCGTTLISTLSTALWNLDMAVLFICLSLWLLVHFRQQEGSPFLAVCLGLFLFLTFFCRPTTAVFVAPTLIYLFFKHRSYFWFTAVTAALLLLGFVLFSLHEFGLLLPAYYLPRQLGGLMSYGRQDATPAPIALYGILLSPSRGFFIYSPFFMLTAVGLIRYRQPLLKSAPVWYLLSWSVGLILLVSRFQIWWGGFSFGPRLLTDMVPAWVLLTILVARQWLSRPPKRYVRLQNGLILLCALLSILIHSYAGLLHQDTLLSHGNFLPPNTDKAPYLLLDWRYPQVLMTADMACRRNETYFQTLLSEGELHLKPLPTGQPIYFQQAGIPQHLPAWAWWSDGDKDNEQAKTFSENRLLYHHYLPLIADSPSIFALFVGWGPPAEQGTWSLCQHSQIIVGASKVTDRDKRLALTIQANGHHTQPVQISVNNTVIGSLIFTEEFEQQTLTFPAKLLHVDQQNILSFYLPGARLPAGQTAGLPVGLFLRTIQIK